MIRHLPTSQVPFPSPRPLAAVLVGLCLLAPALSAQTLDLDRRIACHRALETVYWAERIWPDLNRRAKPPLSSVLPDDALRRRAEDSLAMAAALEFHWGERIRHRDLQAELDRMARDSRRPATLAALLSALGDDPHLAAECLARPLLAERRLRSRFAADDDLHGTVRRRAQASLARIEAADQLRALPGYHEETWTRTGSDGPGAMVLGSDEWAHATAELVRITGARTAPRAGAVSALQETSERFWAVGVLEVEPDRLRLGRVTWPKTPFRTWWESERELHLGSHPPVDDGSYRLPEVLAPPCEPGSWSPTPALPQVSRDVESVWTGAEMLVFGGSSSFNRGGRYDPALDAWYPISIEGEPGRRRDHTAVWTGTEMVVWGGWGFDSTFNVLGDGARYDPLADEWEPVAMSGAPSPRSLHTAVWTGEEMIVWGGCDHFQCFSTLGDGARYDPGTDTWSPVAAVGAPSARGEHVAVWTGAAMVVWGGNEGGVSPDGLSTGGVYDPLADDWSATSDAGAPEARRKHTAVWTDSEMIVWGGQGRSGFLRSGGRYDPTLDSWAATTLTDAPIERRRHTAVWTDSEMIVWGGCRDSECSQHQGNGGRYDPLSDSWTAVSEVGDPGGRSQHTAVWTGTEMILWGGCSSGECQVSRQDGGRYDPVADSWQPTGDPGTPAARLNHTAVWTGAEMIVWGGNAAGVGLTLTGGRYDPATASWAATAVDGTAAARDLHTAVWTGTEMIVWAGRVAGIGTSPIGARYDPMTDDWTSMTTTGAPQGRAAHTATWTGGEMLVWGGCATSSCQSYLDTGGRYVPASDEWLPMSAVGAPEPRFLHTAVQTHGEMVVWGGRDLGGPFDSGGRYDVGLDAWSQTAADGAPAARSGHAAGRIGDGMIVWGGDDGARPLATGALYDPGADEWTPTSTTGAPAARTGHVAATDGTGSLIVWGGCDAPSCAAFQGDVFFPSGGRYEAATDSWSPTALTFAPPGRSLGTAVWSGDRMLVWGGWRGTTSDVTRSGGEYCPSTTTVLFRDGFESGDTGAWDDVVD